MTISYRLHGPAFALALSLAALTSACDWDTTTTRYDDRAAAEAAGVFRNALLPDVVPASARAIQVHEDVDFKIVSGQFDLAANDLAPFLAQLKPGAPTTHPWPIDKEWPQASQGATAANYEADGTLWVFFCRRDPGQCRFYSWPKDYPFK